MTSLSLPSISQVSKMNANYYNPISSPFSFNNSNMNMGVYLQGEYNSREYERKTSMSFNNWTPYGGY